MAEFNIQDYLADMRQEQREDHQALMGKFDALDTKVNDHEVRIVVVENTRRTVRSLVRVVVGLITTGVIDYVFNHKH